jgi:hypothetical protein
MKTKMWMFAMLAMIMVACGDDKDDAVTGGGNGSGNFTPRELTVKGTVEKGPFVSGSVINMQPLNEKMKAVGSTYSATITDDYGSFAFNPEQFDEPYARLSVNGYFYNECTGKLSKGQIMLQGVVDLRDKNSVNVNLLTHLKYQRVMRLIEDGASFAEANKQAQEELLKTFGLQQLNTTDASQFSIAAGTDESAALIVTSALLLGKRGEAEFTEYLAKLCSDFADDGQFTEANREQINKDRKEMISSLDNIAKMLVERYKQLGREITVKPLKNFIDYDGDGVLGNETHDPNKPVTLSSNELKVPVEGGTYKVTIKSDVQLYLTPQASNLNEASTEIARLTAGGILLEKEMADKETVTITVKPTTYRIPGTRYISLYDYVGNTAASIKITQEGDPQGEFLSGYGKELFRRIGQELKEVHRTGVPERLIGVAYNMNEYVQRVTSDEEENYQLRSVLLLYQNWFYALAGRMDGTATRGINGANTQELEQLIQTLDNHYVGNCTTPEQIASPSKDIARYVLALIYFSEDHNQTPRNLLQDIVNSGFYDEYNHNVVMAIDSQVILTYEQILLLLGR